MALQLNAGAVRMDELNISTLRANAPAQGTAQRRAWLLCAVAGLAMAGCATTGGGLAPGSPAELKEKVVAERANARWQALIKRDYNEAYAYFSPASRQSTSVGGYKAVIGAIQYKAATVEKVECTAETCKVQLKVTYDFPPGKVRGIVTPLDEDWIIDQGQAWFVFRG
jgi:hypothetical protein